MMPVLNRIKARFTKTKDIQRDASVTDEPLKNIEEALIPSVNRRHSKLRYAGRAAALIFALALLVVLAWLTPGRKKGPGRSGTDAENTISSLPALVLPPPVLPAAAKEEAKETLPAVPGFAGNPHKALENSSESLKDWEKRKRGGSLLLDAKGTTGTHLSQTADDARGTEPEETELALRLHKTATPGARARLMGDRNFLLAKGAALDCVLETAMDSSLPGLVTCRLSRDVWSDNGRVLLMEKGSQAVGEYQGGMRQGLSRLFVLWTRIKTPGGIVISLDSPGADTLGRSGYAGHVNSHFWQRFGAAILMSFIKDSMTIIANSAGSGTNNTHIYGSSDSGAARIIEKMLESTVNMAPTLVINAGESIRIMVARDLDFSGIYTLKLP